MLSQEKKREEKRYHAFLGAFGMPARRDPFPITAPKKVDYWADNTRVLRELVRAVGDALIFPSSRIHVFYGPYGGGKSFAVSYLADPKTRRVLLKHVPSAAGFKDFLAFSVSANLPEKRGTLTGNVYCGIFRGLFNEIASDSSLFGNWAKDIQSVATEAHGAVRRALRDIAKNAYRTLDGKTSLSTIEDTEGYKLLTMERSKLGSLRTQDDYVKAIRSVAEPLLHKYEKIIVAIDELENLAKIYGSERAFFNDFVRQLHQEIDTGLVLILVFTFQSFEEIAIVLEPKVVSRISETILFDYVRSKREIVEYIRECLERGANIHPSDIIEPEAIEAIAGDLFKRGRETTFRLVNKELHRVFASVKAGKKQPARITKAAYLAARKGISVTDVIQELGS